MFKKFRPISISIDFSSLHPAITVCATGGLLFAGLTVPGISLAPAKSIINTSPADIISISADVSSDRDAPVESASVSNITHAKNEIGKSAMQEAAIMITPETTSDDISPAPANLAPSAKVEPHAPMDPIDPMAFFLDDDGIETNSDLLSTPLKNPRIFSFFAPTIISVSLNKQQLHLFKDHQTLAKTTISSGKSGHRTPTGIFSILQKSRHHRSNLYNGAPMPYMQRLTWSGIALHQGHVTGRPASHGCIRLNSRFAGKLWKMTRTGFNHVIIAPEPVQPQPIKHEKLFAPVAQKSKPPQTRPELADQLASNTHTPVMDASLAPLSADKYSPLAISSTLSQKLLPVAKRGNKPLRIYITRANRRELIRSTQKMLQQLQYYNSPVDGLYGQGTIKAMKRFQRAEGLRTNGTLDKKTLQRLYKLTGQSRPSGMLYVRQGFKQILEAPVEIDRPDEPLGAHLFVLNGFDYDSEKADWVVASPSQKISADIIKAYGVNIPEHGKKKSQSKKERKSARHKNWIRVTVDPAQTLERIDIPYPVRMSINQALTPGSSLAISDNGLGRETGKGTDFVVPLY